MHPKHDTAAKQSLEHLFAEMRRQEIAQAPDFPDTAARSQQDPLPGDQTTYRITPKVAAAIAVLAALMLLLTREPAPQDPAQLYAEIMNASSPATDSLLSVSPGTLPGVTDLPEIYETDTMAGDLQSTN
ncbi:Uncharacterised protein [Halioglobus japonicus]|nr:Uncharacterised protein [Halioglobus japonicus]